MTPEFLSLAYFFPDTRVLLKSLLLSPFRLSNRHLKLQTFITTLLLFLPSRSHLNSFPCHEMSTLSKKNSEDLFISQAWSMCLNLRHHQSSALGQWEPVQVFIKRCFNSQTNIDLRVFNPFWRVRIPNRTGFIYCRYLYKNNKIQSVIFCIQSHLFSLSYKNGKRIVYFPSIIKISFCSLEICFHFKKGEIPHHDVGSS